MYDDGDITTDKEAAQDVIKHMRHNVPAMLAFSDITVSEEAIDQVIKMILVARIDERAAAGRTAWNLQLAIRTLTRE